MLSLGKMRNAIYYLAYTAYYLRGGERLGQWFGKGAERLGLVGAVRKRHMNNMFRGLSPRGDALVQNAGSKKRNAGIDLTFSAPKGVSVLWAIAPKWLRLAIEACHERAVRRALRFLEEELLFLRRGKNGTEQRPCELVAALFQHSSSRLADPNLHTHALVFNAGHADGRWNAIDARYIYAWKMALGALYRTQLVHELWQTIGLALERIKTWVEIAGIVPDRLIRYFSKRSRELRAAMRLYGADSARASDIANLRTRKVKRIIPRPELFRQWRREARALGFGRESVESILKSGGIGTPSVGFESLPGLLPLMTTAVHACIDEITRQRSHFSRRQLIESFLPRATEFKVSADVAIQTIDDVLRFDQQIVELETRVEGEVRFATRTTIAQETALKRRVAELKQQPGRAVGNDILRETMLVHGALRMEQYNALEYLVDGKQRIKALAGVPGGGKTTVLAAAFAAWEKAGLKVVGAAIAGRAARNLEHKSGIESSTLRKLQIELEAAKAVKGNSESLESVEGLPIYPLDQVELDQNTVLVVDEAGMVDTADTLDLLNRIADTGGIATLVLVGDENQLPPIGAGAPFDAIKNDIVHASLSQIRRFSDSKDKEALRLIAAGQPEPALQLYADRELLVVAESPHALREKVVADWIHQGGINRPQDHLILVGTNAERKYYNDELQKQRQEAGVVAREGTVVRGELLAVGDRVMFLKNDRRLDVSNGDLGTLTESHAQEKQQLTVTLDSGRVVTFSPKRYDELTRAYAATVHKFQGGDVPNTYCVLGGPLQSKELTFTQLSRHQNLCCLYTDKIEAGENLERLHRQLRTSSRECLAIEMLARKEANVPPPEGERLAEKKIVTPLAHGTEERLPKLTLAKRTETPDVEGGLERQPIPDLAPKRAGWISLKPSGTEGPPMQVTEGQVIPPKDHFASETNQRPHIRIAPPTPTLEKWPAEVNRPPEGPELIAAADQRTTPTLPGERPPIPSERQPLLVEKQPPVEQVGFPEPLAAPGNTPQRDVQSPTIPRPVPLSQEVGEVPFRSPELREAPLTPPPSEASRSIPSVEAEEARRNQLSPHKFTSVPPSAVDGQTPSAEGPMATGPPLPAGASRTWPPHEPANSSESRDSNAATNSKKRSAETLAEQEDRIAREERAQKIHEDFLIPQVDPTRSGPKPA